jgi:hypothetical protein
VSGYERSEERFAPAGQRARALPLVQVSPPLLNFGSAIVARRARPRAVKVLNNSSSPFNILSISIIGPQTSNFAQTKNCESVLAAGAACVVDVTFTPLATGIRTAKLKLLDGLPRATQYVILKGAGY